MPMIVTPCSQELRRNPPVLIEHQTDNLKVRMWRTADRHGELAVETFTGGTLQRYQAIGAPLTIVGPLQKALQADLSRIPSEMCNEDLLRAIECIAIGQRPEVREAARIHHSAALFWDLSRDLEALTERGTVSQHRGMIDLIEVTPRILRLHFPLRALSCAAFMRFQEHYESPFLKGQVFSRGEFRALYPSRGSEIGEFSYYFDWCGFNFPSAVVKPFIAGKFPGLTRGERAILSLLRPYEARGEYYVIGTSGDPRDAENADTIGHEIRHALFRLNKLYRRSALALMRSLNLEPVYCYLRRAGYARSVFLDEAQAFIGGDLRELASRVGGGSNAQAYSRANQEMAVLQADALEAERRR